MKELEVRWIIESGVLSYTNNLVQYLKKNNIYYKETSYQEVISYNYNDKFGGLVDFEVATVFVGSLRLAKEINKYPIDPGSICTLDNFKCTKYYPSWNPYLLNNDWTITMKSILERDLTNQKFFFRPDKGDKSFTGGIFRDSQIIEELDTEEIIIQASEKNIGDEYRFLVVDKQVIDGVRYVSNGHTHNTKFLKRLRKGKDYYKSYLEEILEESIFLPDRAFTVDIAQNVDTGLLGVIELNSFSCANLYSMNMNKVVPAINELAKDMYREANIDW